MSSNISTFCQEYLGGGGPGLDSAAAEDDTTGDSGDDPDPGDDPAPDPGNDPSPDPANDPSPPPGNDPRPDPGNDPSPDPGNDTPSDGDQPKITGILNLGDPDQTYGYLRKGEALTLRWHSTNIGKQAIDSFTDRVEVLPTEDLTCDPPGAVSYTADVDDGPLGPGESNDVETTVPGSVFPTEGHYLIRITLNGGDDILTDCIEVDM
jgi:hypothetical protein